VSGYRLLIYGYLITRASQETHGDRDISVCRSGAQQRGVRRLGTNKLILISSSPMIYARVDCKMCFHDKLRGFHLIIRGLPVLISRVGRLDKLTSGVARVSLLCDALDCGAGEIRPRSIPLLIQIGTRKNTINKNILIKSIILTLIFIIQHTSILSNNS